MLTFGFPWPENLDCTQFPPNHELCVNGDIQPGNPIDLSPSGANGVTPILIDRVNKWPPPVHNFDNPKYDGPGKNSGKQLYQTSSNMLHLSSIMITIHNFNLN